MDMTAEERQELIQDVINEITTQSTSIDELAEVEDLSGIDSLPAYETSSSNLVKAPIELLSKPANEAATLANAAASSANNAAALATASKEAADSATEAANNAAQAATQAAALTEQTKETIENIGTTASDAKSIADTLQGQLGNVNIDTTQTESSYAELEEKDANTLYFCVEDSE